MRFLDILVFLGWISAKLALLRSKMRLQRNSLPFLPLSSTAFYHIVTRARAEIKIQYVFRPFDFWNFFSPFLFLFFFTFCCSDCNLVPRVSHLTAPRSEREETLAHAGHVSPRIWEMTIELLKGWVAQ